MEHMKDLEYYLNKKKTSLNLLWGIRVGIMEEYNQVTVITYLQRSRGLTSGEWSNRRISELIQNASLVGEQTKDGDVNRVAEGRTFCDTQAQKARRKNIQHNCHFDQSHLRFCIEILLLGFLKHNNTLL